MLRIAGLIGLVMIVTWRFKPGPPDEHTVAGSLEHGGLQRSYLLHVPPTHRKEKPAPLVLAFHGGGGNARGMEGLTRFSALSDKHGFLVVYPEAIEKNWNDGRGVESMRAQRENVDDVGFVAALVEKVGREHGVDPKRVYATGISNGAIFSHFLAAKRSDLVAAIAPVVGGMAAPLAGAFKPERPVSVLVIQGTEDPLVPFAGGDVARNRGKIVGTEEAVRRWVAHDGCSPEPKIDELPDADPKDGTRVKRAVWSGGKDGSEVVLLTVEGGGHTWAGGAQYLPERIIGRTSRDIDASQVIWELFAAHARP